MKKVKILALDQASNCGWCIDGIYGVWDINTRKGETHGSKMLRFRAKLKEVCELEGITLIVYERPAGRHTNSVIHSAKMVAMIETFATESGIDYASYPAKEIKKFASGKGNCSKEEMIKSAKEKYGYDGNDDNEADALHIYYLAKRDYIG